MPLKFQFANGSQYDIDAPFEHDGISYPANFWRLATSDEKKLLGMSEVPDEVPFDRRFYSDSELTPRSLAVCRKARIDEVNLYVFTELVRSDWKIVRASEGYKVCDPATIAYRQAVRNQGNDLVAEINALQTVDAVATWQPHDWPQAI